MTTASYFSSDSNFVTKTNAMTEERVAILESTETTFTKIEFDKFNLFFKCIPNQISYDKVRIKNLGTTCIYFKWQKLVKGFNISHKKSEGIDRFFCHYVKNKLYYSYTIVIHKLYYSYS